jgi:hypothetical protein
MAIETVPDTACQMHAEGTTIFGPIAFKSVLENLSIAGARWTASLRSGAGFVAFDADGANPVGPINLGLDNRSLGSGSNVSVVAQDDQGVITSLYSPAGSPLGVPGRVATDIVPSQIALGTSPTSTLAMWGTISAVSVRFVDDAGVPKPKTIDLETKTRKDSLSMAAAPAAGTADKFLAVWAERREDDRWVTSTAVVTPDGVDGTPTAILAGAAPVRIVAAVRSFDDTYALLLEQGGTSLLLRVNAKGKLSQTGRLFAGDIRPLGLATRSGELGLLGVRPDRTIAFRSLDVQARPISDWVCFEAPGPQQEIGGSVAAGGPTSYAVLYTAKDGAQKLAKVERTGQ